MLRRQTVVLGIVAMVTLPMMSLAAPRVGQVTWPVTDNIRHPGTPKNRKGLRHSPGVLMDVMRSPSLVKPPGGLHWKVHDQLASHSGGHSQRWHHGAPRPTSVPKTLVYLPAITNYVFGRADPRRKPHSVYKENAAVASSVLHPWSVGVGVGGEATTLNLASAPASAPALQSRYPAATASAWQIRPYVMEPAEMTTQPPEPVPMLMPMPTPWPRPQTQSEAQPQDIDDANLVKTEDVLERYVPTGTDAPASFQAPGAQKKVRAHVRIFSNAHQYKRGFDGEVSTAAPSASASPLSATTAPGESSEAASDKSNFVLEAMDDMDQETPWFKELLGQVIAAAEMSEEQH